MSITKENFGTFNQQAIDIYTLTNKQGAYVKICPFGATVTNIVVPNK